MKTSSNLHAVYTKKMGKNRCPPLGCPRRFWEIGAVTLETRRVKTVSMTENQRRFWTTGEAARELRVLEFQLRETLKRHPELRWAWVGRSRAIDPDDLPAIRAALVVEGYL